jgi:hypothetical protein
VGSLELRLWRHASQQKRFIYRRRLEEGIQEALQAGEYDKTPHRIDKGYATQDFLNSPQNLPGHF